ncbi:MAG: aliphatic sulfonate ABC transporter substrate-binding protein [Caenispirillum bisanense]|nr:aliphatic sulfonate ABC transporter substrate-binding protein [Caenispirillum bisanense]MCA1975269.1 aliphatic sulfonate ABC transporter substrate-binding protein [Caenispirillum sp.]
MVRRTVLKSVAAAALLLAAAPFAAVSDAAAAEKLEELRIDYAYYNPVSLVLKEKGWLEDEFAKDGTAVRWVLSLGSNKALEFLNSGSIDLGSTAGAAALLGRINGNPVKVVYAYSKPEWTALVTGKDSAIQSVADLKGKRIAVTRGTDPHIFLTRALAEGGLTEKDVELVLLQHQDGRLALENGDVDAWAGLDPMMAASELDAGSRLFYRNADFNTWGTLLAREEVIAEHPETIKRVIAVYERAREWARANPAELAQIISKAARTPDHVAAKQIERTDLSQPAIGDAQGKTIEAAGLALQKGGIIKPEVDVPAAVADLLDPSFTAGLPTN